MKKMGVALCAFLVLIGCGKKNHIDSSSNLGTKHLYGRSGNDVDGDGVENYLEKSEIDIHVSNIPRLSLESIKPPTIYLKQKLKNQSKFVISDFNLEGANHLKGSLLRERFPNFLVRNGLVRKKITKLTSDIVLENSNSKIVMPSFEDAYLAEFGCLSIHDEYLFSLLKGLGAKIYESSSLQVNVGFNYLTHSSLQINSMEFQAESSSELDNILTPTSLKMDAFGAADRSIDLNYQKWKNCLYFKAFNFDYELDKVLTFSDVSNKVKKVQSHIYISLPGETIHLSVNPDYFSNVTDVLLGLNIEHDITEDGQILSLLSLRNSGLDEKDMNKGVWTFISKGSKDSVKSAIVAGETYILTYHNISELFRASSFEQELISKSFINKNSLKGSEGIRVEDSKVGDIIEIQGKLLAEVDYKGKSQIPDYRIDGYEKISFCAIKDRNCRRCKCLKYETRKKKRAGACFVQRKFKTRSVLGRKAKGSGDFNLNNYTLMIKGSSRSIKPTILSGEHIIYRFQLQDHDIQSGVFRADFKNQGRTQEQRKYVIEDLYTPKSGYHCNGGNNKKRISHLSLPWRLYLHGNLKRWGIKR